MQSINHGSSSVKDHIIPGKQAYQKQKCSQNIYLYTHFTTSTRQFKVKEIEPHKRSIDIDKNLRERKAKC